jgi:hypothetical protein
MELSDAKKAIRRNPPTFGLKKIPQGRHSCGPPSRDAPPPRAAWRTGGMGFPAPGSSRRSAGAIQAPCLREVVENRRKYA